MVQLRASILCTTVCHRDVRLEYGGGGLHDGDGITKRLQRLKPLGNWHRNGVAYSHDNNTLVQSVPSCICLYRHFMYSSVNFLI